MAITLKGMPRMFVVYSIDSCKTGNMWGKRRDNINCYRKDNYLDLDISVNEIHKITD